jgi:hypothetical protein
MKNRFGQAPHKSLVNAIELLFGGPFRFQKMPLRLGGDKPQLHYLTPDSHRNGKITGFQGPATDIYNAMPDSR